MKKLFYFCLALLMGAPCFAAARGVGSFDVYLWPDGFPNSNGLEDSIPPEKASWVARPFMRVFLPKGKATGRIVIALPGGGYSHLAKDHEGYDWAPFFNERGIALAVLCYRIPRGVTEVPSSDVYEAIRYVRSQSAAWGINPDEVGIMGSSAGGHLATTVATHATGAATRPNFQILFYPVVTMDEEFTHRGSRDNLIGKTPTPGLVEKYSNERQVDSLTPPAIILCSHDDKAVPTPNAVQYYLALRRNGVPASLHIYPTGGHGWGFRETFRYHDAMLKDLSDWLEQLKLKK